MKRRIDNTSRKMSAPSSDTLPPIVHAIGGSVGSALAILAFYPLERIRVEMQSQQQQQQQKSRRRSTSNGGSEKAEDERNYIEQKCHQATTNPKETILQCLIRLHKEKSMYRGAKNIATTMMISNFIFFYALQVTRKSLASFQKTHNPHGQRRRRLVLNKSLSSLLSSTLAGVINVLLTNPMWVASLRIMDSKKITPKSDQNNNSIERSASLWDVINQIARTEGPLQLWNGTLTSLLLVSNPIIQHFVYGQMRVWMLSLHRHKGKSASLGNGVTSPSPSLPTLTALEAFVLGAISKMVATVATYPLQLAQVLLRLQQSKKDAKDSNSIEANDESETTIITKEYSGMIDCLQQQLSQGGIPGLFQGMKAKLLSTVLTAAFTFLSYEQTLQLVGKLYMLLNET